MNVVFLCFPPQDDAKDCPPVIEECVDENAA